MLSFKSTRLSLLAVVGLVFWATETASLTVYRLGTPFSAAEKDSLRDLGFDLRELEWSVAQSLKRVELDSLTTGVLQPNFFDVDENIAATALDRGGIIEIRVRSRNNLVGKVLIDGDENTAYEFREITPESFNRVIRERIDLDLGGSSPFGR